MKTTGKRLLVDSHGGFYREAVPGRGLLNALPVRWNGLGSIAECRLRGEKGPDTVHDDDGAEVVLEVPA